MKRAAQYFKDSSAQKFWFDEKNFPLQSTQELDARLTYIQAVITTLRESHRCRTTFRKSGGFVYILSILLSLGKNHALNVTYNFMLKYLLFFYYYYHHYQNHYTKNLDTLHFEFWLEYYSMEHV